MSRYIFPTHPTIKLQSTNERQADDDEEDDEDDADEDDEGDEGDDKDGDGEQL